jgi:hypothetical protein
MQINNIEELRYSLTDNYCKMYDKKMPLGMGKELANTGGKIMASLKLELDYNEKMGYKDKIAFLETKARK